MKNFLTLLAAITSLSAYTLVGVHAMCAVCPKSMSSSGLKSQCLTNGGERTRCQYPIKNTKAFLWCYFDSEGTLDSDQSSYA
ncbi:hypothetical protein BDN67DRAFT_976263, partial [Paxillus ammoniavirescens]